MVTIWLELYKFQFIEQNKRTPTDLTVGVICLLSAYQIFVLTGRRGRRPLQGKIKLPYEKEPLP